MKRKILLSFFIIILVFTFSLIIWGVNPQSALPSAIEGLNSTSMVEVNRQNNCIVFTPLAKEARTGIIFYPGGHVAPEAYATLLRDIAKEGYMIVLIRMPLNLAIFGIDKADNYVQEYPHIEKWVIAGHSVGGAMAAVYSERNSGKVDGVILWASYPSKNTNLTEYPFPVMSIYGSNDGLSTPLEIEKSKHLLPDNTSYIEISGGNHSQFGSYGFQNGDLQAGISIEEQQKLILIQTLKFLDQYP